MHINQLKRHHSLKILVGSLFLSCLFMYSQAQTEESILDSIDSRTRYLNEKIDQYESELDEVKKINSSTEFVWNHLNQEAILQLPSLEKNNQIQEIVEMSSEFDIDEEKAKLNLAALCSISVKERNTDLLIILGKNFDLNILLPISVISSNSRFNRQMERNRSRSINDYPLMNLALECGSKATPALIQVLLDPQNRFNARLYAFAVLYRLDREQAKINLPLFLEQCNDVEKNYMTRYMENPVLQPWEFPMYRTDRMDEVKAKRKTR